MSNYSEIVTEHFLNPRNAGALDSPDAVGQAGAPGAGEFVVLQLKLAEGKISQASFQTFGCGPAIAACSLLTEWLAGKSLAQAQALSPEGLVEMLGGLPEDKLFCAGLAIAALREALAAINPADHQE